MRRTLTKAASAAVLTLAVLASIASSSQEDSGGGGGSGGTATTPETFAIGETAHTGDFDVTVNAVTDPYAPTNQFDAQPAAGNRFVAVELSMTNTGAEPQPISTLANTEITDSQGRLGTLPLTGTELPKIDAVTAAPGELRRGWVVFEVVGDATELKVRIKGNLTATGSLFQL